MIPAAMADDPAALFERCAPKLREVAKRDAARPTWGVLLGPSGVGKTSCAAALALAWLAHHDYPLTPIEPAKPAYTPQGGHYEVAAKLPRHLAWVDAFELAMAERRYKLGTEEPLIIQAATRAAWTIIDDVGHERDTAALLLVLQRRYSSNRPTLITTGLKQQQLVEHIGAAMIRRAATCAGEAGVLVDCHGGAA